MGTIKNIQIGTPLPGPGIHFSGPFYDYAQVLGKNFTLSGVGENQSFDVWLPRNGTATRQVALDDWGNDWLIFQLDEPFEFQSMQISYLIIRARWAGCPIGSDFCPVFILLDPQQSINNKNRLTSKDFDFISWGEVKPKKS